VQRDDPPVGRAAPAPTLDPASAQALAAAGLTLADDDKRVLA
jgi:hypothetical protein